MTKNTQPIRQRPSQWRDMILVCRKCTKRTGGGFGPRQRTPLLKALRKRYALAKGRRGVVGLVETGCFGLCPEHAVTVARGCAPNALYVVPCGAPLDEIVDTLSLSPLLAISAGSDLAVEETQT